MSESRTKKTLINTSFAVLSRIASMVFGFIQKTIFIRTLGMSYTGVSGLFSDILVVLSLAELGIGSAIAFSLYKPIAQNDYRHIAQLMNFFKKAYRMIAFSVFGLGLCVIPFLGHIVTNVPDIKESITLIFFLYIVNTAVTYLLVYKNTLLVASQNQYVVSNIQTVFIIFRTVFECVFLLLLRDFLIYLLLEILFSLLQNITINLVATRRYPQLKQYRGESITKEERKTLFRDIKALMLYKVANVILTGTDSTIISAFLGTGRVGIVGNYKTIKGYVTSIVAQFYNSINPSLGNLAAVESREAQYRFFQKLNFGTFWIACFCSTCFYCLFNPFILIWLGSENWLLSSWTVAMLVLDYYLSTMIGPIGAFRMANGLFVKTKYMALFKAALNLVISLALVKPCGVFGVLFGTVLSCVLTQMWYEPKVLFEDVFGKKVSRYFAVSLFYFAVTAACCAAITGVMYFLPTFGAWSGLLIRFALCLLVPNGVIFLLYRKTQEFRECTALVRKITKSLFQKVLRKGKQN